MLTIQASDWLAKWQNVHTCRNCAVTANLEVRFQPLHDTYDLLARKEVRRPQRSMQHLPLHALLSIVEHCELWPACVWQGHSMPPAQSTRGALHMLCKQGAVSLAL